MMQQEINVQKINDSVKKIGDHFLRDYKQNAIPENSAELLRKLDEMDELCISSLKADLALTFPDIPFLIGDEFDGEAQRRPAEIPEYWLCDAMDGAIQYLQHISGWTINLALIRNGKPYFSVIYDPLSNELFWAKEGEGAFMNDKRLHTGRKTDFQSMIAVFEYGHQGKSNTDFSKKTGATVTKLLESFGVVRNYGPHGLQLAYVGAGRIDLFIQEDLDTFNWIAGLLIAQEAGAEILSTDGNPWHWGSENLLVGKKEAVQKYLQVKQ